MDTLEIELSYLPKLIDVEVAQVIHKQGRWSELLACTKTFDLDISHITPPLDMLGSLIEHKADQRLSAARAERFKSVWQKLTPEQQYSILIMVFSEA